MKFVSAISPFVVLAAGMFAMVYFGPHTTPEQEEAKCRELISTVTRSANQIIAYPDLPGPGTTEWAEIIYANKVMTGRWPLGGC
jgi:hypothetical protein